MSAVSDVKLLDFPSQHTSFTRAFLDYVARYANADALIDPYTGEKLSFLDLSLKVDQSRLRLSSIPKGSIVMSVCGNSISLIVVYLALLDLGITIVPVNPASKQYELEKYLTECRAQYVLTEKDYAMKVGAILVQSKFETISTVVLEELPTEKEPTHMNLPTEPESEDTAFVFFSSGTTGPPKPIRHSHRSLVAHLRQIRSVMDSNSDTYPFPCLRLGDRTHGVLPYFHAGGLLTVFCMLVQGATVVVNGKWNEEGFLRILQDHQITAINIVPPIMDFLVKSPLVNSFDLCQIRYIYVGAARCDEDLLRDLKRRLPNVKDVVQLFGLTEVGTLLFVTPVMNPQILSVGRAMPGVAAKILDENGDQLGPNEVGALMIQAATMMQGYCGKPDFPPNGWFYSGDLASIDAEGFAYIVGRDKEMIKVRGWQVNPYEIEEAIKANIVGVEDCAVVGVPHAIDGHRPKAFVVGQADVDAIVDFVKDTFTSYKHLCSAEIVKVIPRNASGKILRHQLVGRTTV